MSNSVLKHIIFQYHNREVLEWEAHFYNYQNSAGYNCGIDEKKFIIRVQTYNWLRLKLKSSAFFIWVMLERKNFE